MLLVMVIQLIFHTSSINTIPFSGSTAACIHFSTIFGVLYSFMNMPGSIMGTTGALIGIKMHGELHHKTATAGIQPVLTISAVCV